MRGHYLAHKVGAYVNALPSARIAFRLKGNRYYYSSGVYYRRSDSRYIVIAAPLGASIVTLPFGYVDLYVGSSRYFYVNRTYYVYEPTTTKYIVVERPQNVNQTELDEYYDEQADASSDEFIIYPKENQSDERLERDRYECHRWGAEQSGFDPITATNDVGQSLYSRAMVACLEGRGYSVN